MSNMRPLPVFNSGFPSWYINEPKEKVFEILKKSKNGNCCIRPGSQPKTFAITSYIDGELRNFSIREEKQRYQLVLNEEQPWLPSLGDILDYFLSVSKDAVALGGRNGVPLPKLPASNKKAHYVNISDTNISYYNEDYVNEGGEVYYNIEEDEPRYLPMDGRKKRLSDCSSRHPQRVSRQSVPDNFPYINLDYK